MFADFYIKQRRRKMIRKVAVIVGSLRKESFSKKIALVLKEVEPATLQLDFIDLSKLEMFNQDFDDEGHVPASWTEFRQTVKKYDAVLFVTPEYNRSVPPVLKNAVDIGSRPYGENIWDGKPGAVVSVSPGSMGGFGSSQNLRQSLTFLNILTMAQPEVYIGKVDTLLDDNGKMTNEKTKEFLKSFMKAFAAWIEINIKK